MYGCVQKTFCQPDYLMQFLIDDIEFWHAGDMIYCLLDFLTIQLPDAN